MPYSSRCFEVIKFITRERGIMKYLFVAALMALLTAPASADREDRINAAIPLSSTAQTALELLRRVATDHSQLAVLEEQLHTKLRLRALQCGQNYTLAESASTEDENDAGFRKISGHLMLMVEEARDKVARNWEQETALQNGM